MRTSRLSLVGAAVLALVVGAAAGVAGQAQDAATRTLACAQPIEPGDYVGSYDSNLTSADYWVVVPESYAEDAPVPLVMWLSWISDVELDHADWKPHLADVGVLFVVVGETGAWDVEALLALLDHPPKLSAASQTHTGTDPDPRGRGGHRVALPREPAVAPASVAARARWGHVTRSP